MAKSPPTLDAHGAIEATCGRVEENAEILDPKITERRTWREPYTGMLREIWMPGDGDGDLTAEYHDQRMPPDDIKKRWKFYQSTNFDPTLNRVDLDKTFPPRFVVLDDRAAYEILCSNIPRSYLCEFWGLDFGGHGAVRSRRPHRGRGAIADPVAAGNDRFHHGFLINKKDKYYFTGQKDYHPIVWYNSKEQELKRKRESDLEKAREESEARKKITHGKSHNQFTPAEQLTRTKNREARERLGRYVPNPTLRNLAGSVISETTSSGAPSLLLASRHYLPQNPPGDTMKVMTSTKVASPIQQGKEAIDSTVEKQEDSASDEDFPFYRRSRSPFHAQALSKKRSIPSRFPSQPLTSTTVSPLSRAAESVVEIKEQEIAEKQRKLKDKDSELRAAYTKIAELQAQVAMLNKDRD